ncbi:hypothetical protein [Lacisediminihabitans sp.]|jgi:hypothetical protein|uniref:hypothetical protein n=1 Tax=Lacisediminihabitans sp. TaxID=2787631 RepID=UPI002F94BB2E
MTIVDPFGDDFPSGATVTIHPLSGTATQCAAPLKKHVTINTLKPDIEPIVNGDVVYRHTLAIVPWIDTGRVAVTDAP